MINTTSLNLFEEAKKLIPGGVNSPVRAFKAVEGLPPFIERARGSKIYDVDGNEYIDYVGSWGPMILGHSHPEVEEALKEAIERGTSYGAPTRLEVELARLIVEAYPSIEMVRMVNSGTEATMSALRLARAFTKRDKIIKFEGCYHGHSDSLLVKAGSGATTLGVPTSPGVPSQLAKDTCVARFNDMDSVREIMDTCGEEVAAVILEPIPGNMGVILPEKGFLEGLREITEEYGSLLIFDEVMTGFRVAYGGAQELYGIRPDLTCLGKIIGGGLPVGAFGGRKEIMGLLAPEGPVYQAGTLSGNPLAMTAGIETIKILKNSGTYKKLEENTRNLCNGLREITERYRVTSHITQAGSMFTLFFTEGPVRNYQDALKSDTTLFARFHKGMLKRGIYLPPSQFEAAFISLAHTEEDIRKTIEAAEEVVKGLQGQKV